MEQFEQYFVSVIRDHYMDFEGRARRKEYWMFTLFNILIAFAIGFVLGIVSETMASGVSGLYTLALFLPGLGLAVRRLHDIGKSGWFLLVALIPILGIFVLLYFMVQEGDQGPNEYGEDPKNAFGAMRDIEDFEDVLNR